MYDLNVQIGCLTEGYPNIVYIQGERVKACKTVKGKGKNGENFYVCKGSIRPMKGVSRIAMIVDTPLKA